MQIKMIKCEFCGAEHKFISILDNDNYIHSLSVYAVFGCIITS